MESNLPKMWNVPDCLPFDPLPAADPTLERERLEAVSRLNGELTPAARTALIEVAVTTRGFLRGALAECSGRPPFVRETAELRCRSTLGCAAFFDAECL